MALHLRAEGKYKAHILKMKMLVPPKRRYIYTQAHDTRPLLYPGHACLYNKSKLVLSKIFRFCTALKLRNLGFWDVRIGGGANKSRHLKETTIFRNVDIYQTT